MNNILLTDEQVIEIHRLITKLYEKYPDYVVCDIAYSTNMNRGTTLPPEKEMRLNVYTPIINHNHFYNFEDFKNFVEQILANGIKNVRIEILEEEIARRTESKKNDIDAIKSAQEELDSLKEAKNEQDKGT